MSLEVGRSEVALVTMRALMRTLRGMGFFISTNGAELTSPVCVKVCSASLEGLKYALSQPSKVQANLLSVLDGGLRGGEGFEGPASAATTSLGRASRARAAD